MEVFRTGRAGRAVGAAPVFELYHLLLPRTQAPSLGADGEDAIVLHAHLVQLCAVKLYLLCPELQVDLLVTWEEEGPGGGMQSRRVEEPLSQTRGRSSEPQVGCMEASSITSPSSPPLGKLSHARLSKH